MVESVALASPRGRGVLAAVVLGSGVALLDTTVVNVALPTLERDLHAGMAGLQWVVDAYLLFLGALLLVGGALGDRLGRRRVFAAGLSLFGGASAICGLAPTVEWLIAARALQGIGGAFLVPGSLSLLRAVVREEDQGRAIGLWSGLSGVTTALGPLLGGWLIQAVSWRAAFFINLPLIALALWVLLRFAPESRDEQAPGSPDWPGAGLATAGLGGAVYALIEGPARGWSGITIAVGVVGVVALVAFVLVEKRRRAPMLPMELFRSLQFVGANATTLGMYFALNAALFFLVMELQRVAGYSPLEAGASMLPMTALLLVLSPVAGKWVRRVGHRPFMTAGPLIAALGLAMLTGVGAHAPYWRVVFPGVAVLGVGLAATVAPLTDAALSGAPRRHAGVASGFNNAVARIAGLLAVALLPGVAGLAGTAGSADEFRAGVVRALWICAGLAAAAGAIAFGTIDRTSTAADSREVRSGSK
jgi:EmrB/QacA subfamily drug resistance transporter